MNDLPRGSELIPTNKSGSGQLGIFNRKKILDIS